MGKKSSKTSSTSKPPKWAVPPLKDALGDVSRTITGNQDNLDEMAGNIRGFLPGLGEHAFGDNPGLNAATDYATDVLGGKYLGAGNPYMQGMIDQTDQSVRNQVNNMFAKSGASLGSAHAGVLGRELANAENGLRYQNYGNERNAQTQAAGLMPSLNASQYAGVMPYLAANQTAAGLPYTGIQNYGVLGSILGGYGRQSGTQPGGWGDQILGSGVGLAALFGS